MANETTKSKATETALNVYQKLLKARVAFLEAAPKKSGKHMQLEFKYFELEDIVPTATQIFAELGLLFKVSFTNELAVGEMVNTDNPFDEKERIMFTVPMTDPETIESKTGKQVTSKIQAMGALQTYQRRYLYMNALDIVENDSVDGATGSDKKEKPTATPKAPVTPEKREEVKKDLVGKDEQANELQIRALKDSLKKLRELDPTQEDFIQTIVAKTEKFTKIKKTACENLILKIGEMLEAYAAKAAKTEDKE
jgi:hypothetical protein